MSKQEQISSKNQQALLTPSHVFGIRTDINNCIQYFSNEKCAYIAGYYGILMQVKRIDQHFISPSEDHNEITSFSVDEANDTIVFVVTQKLEDKVSIIFRYIHKSYYTEDTSKRKIYTFGSSNMEVIASSLNVSSSNGLYVALVGNATQNMLIIYSMEPKFTPKLIHKQTLNLKDNANFTNYTNVLINKVDTNKIAIWGNGGFAIITLNGKEVPRLLEVFQDKYPDFKNCNFNIVSCTWLKDSCVAFLNEEFDIMILDLTQKHKEQKEALIKRFVFHCNNCFEPNSKAFAIFEKNSNLFVTNEKGFIVKLDNKATENKTIDFSPAYAGYKSISNLPEMKLKNLAISKVNDTTQNFGVLMTTENGQIYHLDLTNDNAICDGQNYKYLTCQFHSGEITSIDVAKWKSLVVSCSRIDKSVCVWNYSNHTLEAREVFEEEPMKVAFHPNGLHIAVLFKDQVKLYDILEDSLKEYRTLTLFSPADVKFSNLGHLISICYKTAFRIFNVFSPNKIMDSLEYKDEHSLTKHSETLNEMVWDNDDSGFCTVGQDGRVIYWNYYDMKQPLIFHEKNAHFYKCAIMTQQEDSSNSSSSSNNKKIFLLTDKDVREVYQDIINKDDENKKDMERGAAKSEILFREKCSDILYDQELKLLILTSPENKTCSISIIDYGKFMQNGGFGQNNPGQEKEKLQIQLPIIRFPANTMGINCLKASSDMTNIFTGGKDKCLFFFSLKGVSKSTDKREFDVHEPDNLILKSKEYLDNNARELKQELSKLDNEIIREEEDFKKSINGIHEVMKKEKKTFEDSKKDFDEQINNLTDEIKKVEEINLKELENIQEKFDQEMTRIQNEQDIDMRSKEEDLKNAESLLKMEKTKEKKELDLLQTNRKKNEKELQTKNEKVLEELNAKIEELQKKQTEIKKKSETNKTNLMDANDKDIAEKRREMDKLKNWYEETKKDHKEQEDALLEEIRTIRALNRDSESKIQSQRSDLKQKESENATIRKQIEDIIADKQEKEETIKDKNELKHKLDKDNQELEKFKYVLHYKIKELKHNKEPKERKIQQMEKKAKDMEREIKSCELGQATIIINLSSNHQIIKIHEEQISKTEKRIEELRRYKKLFQEYLYNAMKRAKNHKDCKKELVLLKRKFLDKENGGNDKHFESNYEEQREFLERNVAHYKKKIKKLTTLFKNDHNKVMKEKRQLIDIVNQLEKEKNEIKKNDYKKDEVQSITKPKIKLKPEVPRFSELTKKKKKDFSNQEELTEEEQEDYLKELSIELKNLEKDIQLRKQWKKIQEKEKNLKANARRPNAIEEEEEDD